MREDSAQKKTTITLDRTNLIEGVSRKIKRQFQAIVDQFQAESKRKNDQISENYVKMCSASEQISILANQCFNLFLGDTHQLTINSRNPLILLKYVKLFLQSLIEIKKADIRQKKMKKAQNDLALATYNQNNIYELVAKKNIEFLQLQNEITQLKNSIMLATKRSIVAQEMSKQNKQNADQLLKVYRQSFVKISDMLRMAEQKESQLLQSNRYLNQQIQTINLEFESYKKNYKIKQTSKEEERRFKERVQKDYDDKLALITKQIQFRYRKDIGKENRKENHRLTKQK